MQGGCGCEMGGAVAKQHKKTKPDGSHGQGEEVSSPTPKKCSTHKQIKKYHASKIQSLKQAPKLTNE